jgi:hypothetical protein
MIQHSFLCIIIIITFMNTRIAKDMMIEENIFAGFRVAKRTAQARPFE